MPNKLRQRRVEINLEFASIDQFVDQYISNVSGSGAFIKAHEPWPVGTVLNLRLTVLADDPEILEGMAKVVRVNENPKGMGVEFLELTDSSKALLKKLVARKATVSADK